MSTYSYSGVIDVVTVAKTGIYDITAYGGAGGSGLNPAGGGLGAEASGDVKLTAGETLDIVVGGQGANRGPYNGQGAGGGGGGSFVLETAGGGGYTPLVIAGGGGGAKFAEAAGPGQATTAGQSGTGLDSYAGSGGSAGGGGGPGSYSGGSNGGGGGGLFSAGGTSTTIGNGRGGGTAPGFAGGVGSSGGANGGFGGGGGGGRAGGGGGGYSGGGGGGGGGDGTGYHEGFNAGGVGGGGGSFVTTSATDTDLVAGEHSGNGEVILTFLMACFASGTRLRAARGEVAVEDLRVGELVETASGALQPVQWIGHRHVDIAAHPRPHEVTPVRIAAGAFGPGAPVRDLLVSPDHAVFVEGVLIPARRLINGASIVQQPAHSVTYWHVELAEHDILLADGLPCESYLDTGNRAAFENNPVVDLHPRFARDTWAERGYAPLVERGPLLARVRARLAAITADLELRPRRILDIALGETGVQRIAVAAGVAQVRLLSTSCHVAGDERQLGALLGAVRLDGIEVASAAFGLGFHAAEIHGGRQVRWTDGEAMLDIDDGGGERKLELTILHFPSRARSAA